jgi:hypothetical protein
VSQTASEGGGRGLPWEADPADVAACRGASVEVHARRSGPRGAWEGFVQVPHEGGRYLYRTGRIVGAGARTLARHLAREWAVGKGLVPREARA